MRSGRFRQDLLYRINVLQIDVPPLRERPDDILPVADGLLAALRGPKPIYGFTDAARDALRRYDWPGNVRELRNVIERAVLLCGERVIGVEHLTRSVQPRDTAAALAHPLPRLQFLAFTTSGYLMCQRSQHLRSSGTSWSTYERWNVTQAWRIAAHRVAQDGDPAIVNLHNEVAETIMRREELVLS